MIMFLKEKLDDLETGGCRKVRIEKARSETTLAVYVAGWGPKKKGDEGWGRRVREECGVMWQLSIRWFLFILFYSAFCRANTQLIGHAASCSEDVRQRCSCDGGWLSGSMQSAENA